MMVMMVIACDNDGDDSDSSTWSNPNLDNIRPRQYQFFDHLTRHDITSNQCFRRMCFTCAAHLIW